VEAVRQAFARFPPGTSRERLIEAREVALSPWRDAVVKRRQALRTQADEGRKKQVAAFEAQFRPPKRSVHRAPTVSRRPPASR
jgi:hypothetical protein